MRLFIAIPVPPDVTRALTLAQNRLRTIADGGRYVPKENFHLTLHFIGESNDLTGAAAACDEAVRGIRPFLLRLCAYGSFVRGNSRTGYISLSGDLPELYRLHETLTAELASRGFPLSGGHKRLTPHITLARALPDIKDAEALEALLADAKEGAAFTANRLVLFESRNENGRMVYTPLHKSALVAV
ncbi:MAG TPA: RNA 2',3'-cyclic phosphodiesterase [Feifaniaceae bacterium]|nr:RNA 2',3'-cyclic phosphodiesterase [Feifaniaceae bacterium]